MDDTFLRFPRRSRTDATEPAPRGLFAARNTTPWVAVQWAFALLMLWLVLVLSACAGPDDAHADADVQTDLQAIADALAGERPSYITEADWIAAKHALLTAQGEKQR